LSRLFSAIRNLHIRCHDLFPPDLQNIVKSGVQEALSNERTKSPSNGGEESQDALWQSGLRGEMSGDDAIIVTKIIDMAYLH
jgi:hypothetical protein